LLAKVLVALVATHRVFDYDWPRSSILDSELALRRVNRIRVFVKSIEDVVVYRIVD
jgi:hypothetical protein